METGLYSSHSSALISCVGVGISSPSVCLSLCLLVCLQHDSKTNDPKVLKVGIINELGSISDWSFVLKSQRSRLAFGLAAIRRGFGLSECLL